MTGARVRGDILILEFLLSADSGSGQAGAGVHLYESFCLSNLDSEVRIYTEIVKMTKKSNKFTHISTCS